MHSKIPARTCASSRLQQGVSLLELMISVVVIAVVAGLAVPSFREMTRNNRLDVAADTLFSHLLMARNHAVTHSETVRICARDQDQCASGDEFDWSKGWLVFEDLDDDKDLDPGERVLAEYAPGADISRITFRTGESRLRYLHNGIGYPNGTFNVCDTSTPAAGRKVIVHRNGRPRLPQDHEPAADCS